MSTIAEFTIPALEFPLGNIVKNQPGVTVELERMIPTNTGIIPYLWVHGLEETEQQLEDSFRGHQDVLEVELIDEVNGEYLLRVEWKPDYQGLMQAITETNVAMLTGFGTADAWHLELRADDHHAIAEFQNYCHEHDIPAELTALHALSEMQTGAKYDLTDAQREALVLAYERGFYQTPREATLDDLGDDLGITAQSVGSRLKRGTHRLIGSTLIGPPT